MIITQLYKSSNGGVMFKQNGHVHFPDRSEKRNLQVGDIVKVEVVGQNRSGSVLFFRVSRMMQSVEEVKRNSAKLLKAIQANLFPQAIGIKCHNLDDHPGMLSAGGRFTGWGESDYGLADRNIHNWLDWIEAGGFEIKDHRAKKEGYMTSQSIRFNTEKREVQI